MGVFLLWSCGTTYTNTFYTEAGEKENARIFVYDTNYVAARFRSPVGNPPGKGYYNAQPFMRNTHLGKTGMVKAEEIRIWAIRCMPAPTDM